MSSDPEESPPPPPPPAATAEQPVPQPNDDVAAIKPDVVRDVVLWRRKQLNIIALLAATVTWVVLEIYRFKFVTVVSWVAMFIVAFMYAWGLIHRLLGKEPPDLSRMDMSEGAAKELADGVRGLTEEFVRWMFRVSAEREWFVFAGVVACLWLFSLVASRFDLVTLLYMATVASLTLPVGYVKYQHKIVEYGQRAKGQSRSAYGRLSEKLNRVKNSISGVKTKQKKME